MLIAIIIALTVFFALGSVSPLLLTDDTQQVVALQPPDPETGTLTASRVHLVRVIAHSRFHPAPPHSSHMHAGSPGSCGQDLGA